MKTGEVRGPIAPDSFDFHGDGLDNIFETYGHMRSECPVAHSDKYGKFWALTRYGDIHAAERDWQTYSVKPTMLLPAFGTDRPMVPIDLDPPQHTEYRKLLLPYFTLERIDALEVGARRTARGLMADLAGEKVFDASSRFARPVPTIVFSEYAGFPIEDAALFDTWVDQIIYARNEDELASRAAADEVYDYFRRLLDDRRREPGGEDIISGMLSAEIDGRPLNDDELLDICFLLFVAGLDTSAWAIRSSLWYLAQEPADRRRLAENPSLIPSAAEEFLRTLSPVQAMARTLTRDTEVRGVTMRAGERVALVFGAGNRDHEIFDGADTVRIDRSENPHFAFGVGVHRCLGSNLGRRELKVGLEEFLVGVPDFELAEPAPWHGIGPLMLRVNA